MGATETAPVECGADVGGVDRGWVGVTRGVASIGNSAFVEAFEVAAVGVAVCPTVGGLLWVSLLRNVDVGSADDVPLTAAGSMAERLEVVDCAAALVFSLTGVDDAVAPGPAAL